ncbi:hypothetical protein POVWA2_088100 [Plasmodium ovale wallikeri]|uniref:Uncharacterized protein n=1 Tax=Plasmodium ovale wallikeri TaxID=864142 RepID=A0A1A9AF85_PLAOA|nr:hypothetical protein POVWA1_068280 [Plasmodium ovale wallikeri]SBT58814.1 hypothetical protein POVWA2_088100 [Plasmodium ovale wallikeri]
MTNFKVKISQPIEVDVDAKGREEKKHLNEHAKLKDIIKSTLGGNQNAAMYTHRGAMHIHIPGSENDLAHNVQKERKYFDIPSKRNNCKGTVKNDHNLHSNEIAGSYRECKQINIKYPLDMNIKNTQKR